MKKTFFIRTYGCQMNFSEAERLRELLLNAGWKEEKNIENASVVMAIGCSIREKAENRVISFLKTHRYLKNKGTLIGLFGCTANLHKEKILEKIPFLDILCGPNHLNKIPEILENFSNGNVVVMTGENEQPFLECVPSKNDVTMAVPITKGCNNFCSYCVVPLARGKLVSRHPDSIIREIECAVEKGIKSVTLLGQNVNEYGQDFKFQFDFGDLLNEIVNIDGLLRIDFLTSHPEDTGEKILKIMAENHKIIKHLHIPLQSGSNKILKAMNRKYTVEKFLRTVEMARNLMPEISITSDIMVGFPGETEEDFEKTVEVVKNVRFNELFIFKYSPRPMTKAYNMNDDVPQEVKEYRHQLILSLQKKISNQIYEMFKGRICDVLIERKSIKNPCYVIGRNIQGIPVTCSCSENIIGSIVKVKIINHRQGLLYGSICEEFQLQQDPQFQGKKQI